jgi:hypothetical protein
MLGQQVIFVTGDQDGAAANVANFVLGLLSDSMVYYVDVFGETLFVSEAGITQVASEAPELGGAVVLDRMSFELLLERKHLVATFALVSFEFVRRLVVHS